MNKKFIYFKTKTQFTAKLSSLPSNAIVFIEDTKQIWTHGVFFDTSWDNVTGKPNTYTPSAHTLGSHSDVTLAALANGNILRYNGSKWVNNTLAQAGIATPTDITTAINNIEIGGRNYFSVNDFVADNKARGYSTIEVINYEGNIAYRSLYIANNHLKPRYLQGKFEANTQYYLKFNILWESYTDSRANYSFTIRYTDGTSSSIAASITQTYREILTAANKTIDYITTSRQYSGDVVIYNIQLEKGNKPTDWSPSPKDQVSDWNETGVTSFSYIKNKPTTLADFTDNIGVATHIANKANPHAVTFAQLGAKPTTLGGYGITDGALKSLTLTAGNGLTGGGNLTADRTITLGTPSNITATSTNSVTATSHTHNLVMGSGSGLDADLLDGHHASETAATGLLYTYREPNIGNTQSWYKLGTLTTPAVTSNGSSKVVAQITGLASFGSNEHRILILKASTRGSISVNGLMIKGNSTNVRVGYVDNGSNIEIWVGYAGAYNTATNIQILNSNNFTVNRGRVNSMPTGFVTGPISISATTDSNVASATTASKLGTATVGSTQLPIYLNAGTATAITQANLRKGLFGTTAIGSTTRPIYIAANGVPTEITGSIANSTTGNAATATTATNVALANRTTNASHYISFSADATGNRPLYTNAGLTFNPSTKSLSIGGNLIATGEITAHSSSDIRLKDNIKSINNPLAIINLLDPVTYNWNDKAIELNGIKTKEKKDYGLIAQDVEKIIPEVVGDMYDGEYKGIDYVKLVPILIGAIKELNEEINELKNKINYL